MNRLPLRKLALIAAGIGVAVGLVVAVAVPKTRSGSSQPTVERAKAPRVASADPRLARAPDVRLRVHRDTVKIALRKPDPRGGPDWVIRTFLAERVVRPAMRRHGVDPVVGRNRCAQLGRMVDRRFGWIDGANVFRPVGFQYLGAPLFCGSRLPDMNRQPELETATLVTDPTRLDARPLLTFAWGIGGPAARRIDLDLDKRAVTIRPGPGGVFLAFGGPQLTTRQVHGEFIYGAARVRVPETERLPGGLGHFPPPDPDAAPHLDARAPDPNGGLPWGLASVPGADGGYCISDASRIVGERVGHVDFTQDTMKDPYFFECSKPGDAFGLSHVSPISMVTSSGTEELAEGADPGTGRTARRTLPGITTFAGVVRPGVASVTVATPRGIRTLVPGGSTHAILAVYDGTFPTGEVRLTSQFRDGSIKTMTLSGFSP